MARIGAQLLVLATLDRPREILHLAQANGLPHRTAHQAVDTLEGKGLLTSHRDGRHRVVTPASKALPTLARRLLEDTPRNDWGGILHGDRAVQLHVLERVGDPTLAAQVCGKARSTLYHTIDRLGTAGVLTRRDGAWRINPRLGPLRDFVDEWARVRAHHHANRVDLRATLLWYLGPELLLRSRKTLEGPDVQPGGFSAFGRYGIDLLVGGAAYHHVATRRTDAADAILQGLLAEPESRVHRSYCALLYEKTRPTTLLEKAPIYGLEQDARRVVAYVESHEAPDGFLPWKEHERYRRQYEVA